MRFTIVSKENEYGIVEYLEQKTNWEKITDIRIDAPEEDDDIGEIKTVTQNLDIYMETFLLNKSEYELQISDQLVSESRFLEILQERRAGNG